MKYADYLTAHTGDCHFCVLTHEKLIDTPLAYLTFAIAPYHEHHLLVIPTRHMETYLDLTNDEREAMHDLLVRAMKALKRLGYVDYSILMREGGAKYKSVPHLHMNVIPCDAIGSLTHDGKERAVLEPFEIATLKESLRKVLSDG